MAIQSTDRSECRRLAQYQRDAARSAISAFSECLCCRDMTVIICPAPDTDQVEHLDQKLLFDRFIPANRRPDFFQEGVHVFLGRFYQKFAVLLADVHSEEVEPLLNVRDAGFLWRELQTPVAQKLLDQWFDFIFQQLLNFRAGDDEVIRISYESSPWGGARCPLGSFLEVLVETLLQSVQCQVGQHGNNPALWRACLRGEEDSIFHSPAFNHFRNITFSVGICRSIHS